MRGVNLVAELRLPVGEIKTAGLDQVAGSVGELDPDHRIVAPVADEDAGVGAVGEARLPALEGREEAAEAEYPSRRWPLGAEARRVAHHRAHRKAAKHSSLRPDPA